MQPWTFLLLLSDLSSIMAILKPSSAEILTIKATSTTGGSYYLGQPLKITCRTSHIPDAFYMVRIFFETFSVACQYSHIESLWYGVRIGLSKYESLQFEHLSNADCNLPEKDNTMTVNLNITGELSRRNITCNSYTINSTTYADSTLSIAPIYGPPRDAKIVIDVDPVIENQTFTAHCSSSSKTSVYIYELSRKNTTIAIPEGKYTPTPADRKGFQIRCVDIGNYDWRTISLDDIELSTNVLPSYITHNLDLPNYRYLELKPSHPVSLRCDIEGRPTPTYTWSSHINNLTTFTNDTPIYDQDTDIKGTGFEIITCSATVAGVGLKKMLMITWVVRWVEDEPCTTQTTELATDQGQRMVISEWIYAGSAGGFVMIIFVCSVCICCWRKRNDASEAERDEATDDIQQNQMSRLSDQSRRDEDISRIEMTVLPDRSYDSVYDSRDNPSTRDPYNDPQLARPQRNHENEYETINLAEHQADPHSYAYLDEWRK